MREIIKTTCPRDCYDACGIAVVKHDGAITKVLGDAEHPVARGALCGKCALAYNGIWRDETARLTTPLKRIGNKGEGKFAPATWDEALRDIAARLNAIRAENPAKILHTHYTGTVAMLAGSFGMRFFNAIGATEVDPDSVCNKAGHVALNWTLGDSCTGFDPRAAAHAACIVVWGANPFASAPHMHKHWLAEAPGKIIVIDPIRHPTAERAHLHLQLRPGSDAALAFGFMHIATRDGLLDTDFIADHVLGWDDLAAEVAKATPAWTSAATDVPVALIEEAAKLYATGPSLLWLGQGVQRQPKGGNVFRAAAALAAVTGNLAKTDAGLCYLNGPATRGVDMARLTGAHLAGPNGAPSVSHLDLAEVLADPARASALLCWNNNILASSPRQAMLRQSLVREDLLHVCLDLFSTDTTDYADWILPAASFLEFDDLVLPYFNLTVSAQVKASEPMGNALPNQEIFRRLARAMGLTAPALYETDAQMLDQLVAETKVAASFAELVAAGTQDYSKNIVVPFAGGSFPTPSGKVEIRSAQAVESGAPALPFAHADDPAAGEKLRVLSPASPWTMNSAYGNDPKIREKLGEATVSLHPQDAAARNLAEGKFVLIRNEEDSITMKLHLDATLPRGVALAPKGRWPRFSHGSNINALYNGAHADIGESTAVHGVEAEIIAI
ncbi:MAG: dehydrogenase [Acidocella sp. 20-57-95]|nr:MAG: dehydrogenase [Acidocella sp. 20-57-95]OYV59860.1 MAG: dehydrogenase [Acidocella sp. 21-58-7]HQT65149.1 molybdopterin-dependent oxidoreductase [Acidocella sp.]HQU03569.1 molybdopterin-dependent oxidoreductase [Acidocella sp.]